MKSVMIMVTGVLVTSVFAQDQSLPPPPVPVPPAPVVVSVPVPPPAIVAVPSAGALMELEPGAICKTYLLPLKGRLATQTLHDEIMEKLESSVAIDVGYDALANKFDAKHIAKHKCNVAVWEGVFVAKKAGKYVFTVNSGFDYNVTIGNGGCYGGGKQTSFVSDLVAGPNRVTIVRLIATDIDLNHRPKYMGYDAQKEFNLDYRLATAVTAAKPITPKMLQHVVEDVDEW